MELAIAVLAPLILFLACVWRRPDRRIGLLFAAIVLVYTAPYVVLQGTPVSLDYLLEEAPWASLAPAGYLQKNHLLNDIPLQMLPWMEAVREHWTSGTLPVLDRSAASGSNLWANAQAQVLFPGVSFALILSTFAWPLAMLTTKLLLALWGMYLLLGRMELSIPSRVFGAISYAFCTFMIAFGVFPHTNVIAFLPLLLALFHDVPSSWRATAIAAIVLAVMLLGGHPESVFHSALIAVPYAAALAWRSAVRFATLGVLALMMAAPLLLPMIEHLPHSQRLHEIREQPAMLAGPSLTATNALPFLIPNYFGNPRVHNYRSDFNFNELCTQYAGLSALILAIAAAMVSPRKHRFWIVAFVALVLLTFQPGPVATIVQHIPLLNLSPNGRLRFILALIIAILGAHGFEMLRGTRATSPARMGEVAHAPRIIAITTMVVAAAVALICLLSYPLFAQYGIRRLIFFTEIGALASAAAILLSLRSPRWLLSIPALLFVDLVSVMPMYNPAVGRDLFYPPTPAIRAMQDADRATNPYRVTGVGHALPPNTARFAGLEDIRMHDPTAYRPYVALLDAAGFDRSEYFGQFRTLPPKSLLDSLGVRYVITAPDTDAVSLPIVYAGADAKVYRNESALPRYRSPAGIRLLSYDANGSKLEVRAASDTFVETSEVALPGHKLTRNGEPWPTETIQGAFVGWRAPAGTSLFRLHYEPPHLTLSLLLAAIGALMTAILLFARVLRSNDGHLLRQVVGDREESPERS